MNAQTELRDPDQPPPPAGLHPAKAGLFAGDDPAAKRRVECISFSIGEEQYGVDIMAVREIKGWSEITHLPKQPDYVRGVLNLRGVMVPIIDLRCRFGQGHTEASALHVVIVVQVEARLIGLLADRVLDILSFEAGQIQAVPKIAQLLERRFPVRAGHSRGCHDRFDRSAEPAFRGRYSGKRPGRSDGCGDHHDVTAEQRCPGAWTIPGTIGSCQGWRGGAILRHHKQMPAVMRSNAAVSAASDQIESDSVPIFYSCT